MLSIFLRSSSHLDVLHVVLQFDLSIICQWDQVVGYAIRHESIYPFGMCPCKSKSQTAKSEFVRHQSLGTKKRTPFIDQYTTIYILTIVDFHFGPLLLVDHCQVEVDHMTKRRVGLRHTQVNDRMSIFSGRVHPGPHSCEPGNGTEVHFACTGMKDDDDGPLFLRFFVQKGLIK